MKNVFLIVNCNDYKSTKHLVDNIIDYKVIDKILIVDNNSNEEEKKMISTIKHDKIEIIYNEENNGYSSAINIGSKYLIKKYKKVNLIISNSDIVIMSEDDLSRMIEYLNYDKVGLVGPQILQRGNISRGWKSPSPWGDIVLNTPIIHNFFENHIIDYDDEYYENDISVVDVISSCFFLISSETLTKINYMDENIFLYYEDNILCKKVRDLGLMIIVCNKIKIKHLYSISVDKIIKTIPKYKLYNDSQYYFQVTYNKANLLARIFLRISANLSILGKSMKNKITNKKKKKRLK